ncbi:DUF5444 family protein [Pantoea sp. A4]|uniref:DUF5444 family protein n=1 Tax=Pantoea sp. A4 TaxID=1225184 RepID=UPI0003738C39|nr:DUF5444 family protein [Pantoea sp. A4]
MKITPVNGCLRVSQANAEFRKKYTAEFPDSPEGMKKAFNWAQVVALGWHDFQDADFEKYYGKGVA